MAESKKLPFLIITVSTVLILVAISVAVLLPSIYEQKLEEETNLVDSSFLYSMWEELPLPVHQRLYFFNITNAKDYMKYGGLLEVDEVGPYTYKSRWVKKEVERHPNGTISYREVKTFVFSMDDSVGSQDDYVYTLNGPLLLAVDFLKDKSPTLRKAADKALWLINEKLVIRAKVRELAFDGYSDPIIGMSWLFRPETPFRDTKFCWLYGRNATDDGLFNVFTGETDHKRLSLIDNYNGASHLTFWKNESCNRVNGSNGEFGPPLSDDQSTYTFFQPIFCRSMTFNYTGDRVTKGLRSKRFVNTADTLSKRNPDNYCFDIDPELDSGVIDATPCQYQAPVVLSFPHFYLADQSYFANIDGLEPDSAKHGSYIDAEPLTGATVNLSIKFQMNIKVRRDQYLSVVKNVEPGVYPIFWLEIEAVLPDDLASTLGNYLYLPKPIVSATLAFLATVSVVMIVISVWKLLKGRKDEASEKKPLLIKEHGVYFTVKSRAVGETVSLTNQSNMVAHVREDAKLSN